MAERDEALAERYGSIVLALADRQKLSRFAAIIFVNAFFFRRIL